MDRPLPLHVLLEPSRIAQRWCLALGCAAVIAIALSGLAIGLKALLMPLTAGYAVRACRTQRRPRWRAIGRDGGVWQLLDCQECLFTVERRPGGYCGLGLVVIPFLLPGGETVEVLVWPDSAGHEARRLLRIAWQEGC